MVGRDGYCPQGHLARPELQMKPPNAAPPPLTAAAPVPPGVPAAAPAEPSAPAAGVNVPAGLGPSNPSLDPATASGVLSTQIPAGPPPVPPEQLFAVGGRSKRAAVWVVTVIALAAVVVFALFFLGQSAGASNLKRVFTAGETHTYSMEMTSRGRAGTLNGGITVNQFIDAQLTQRTGAVDKNGSATLTFTLTNLHFSSNGRRIAAPPGTGGAFTVRVQPDGRVTPLDNKDPFGLEDVNPAALFVSPSNAGPLLPDHTVKPGESWTIDVSQKDPNFGSIDLHAVNTLLQHQTIDGNDAVVIRSLVTAPIDITVGHDQLVDQAKRAGDTGAEIPDGAGIKVLGNLSYHSTQTIYTSNGVLQSVLGDFTMRGTTTVSGVAPQDVSVVFDLNFGLTMTKTSTGQSA